MVSKKDSGSIVSTNNIIDRAGTEIDEYNKDDAIRSGVELIAPPVPVSYSELSSSPNGKLKLHKLEQLLDQEFYNQHLFPKTVKMASEEKLRNRDLIDTFVSSPVEITHVPDEIFSDSVNYKQAIQFARESEVEKVSTDGPLVNKYTTSEGVLLGKFANDFKGLAHVAIFSEETDFRDYFESPVEMNEFDGSLDYKDASRIYETHFRDSVNNRAEEIESKMGVKVKGVLLSPIKALSKINDNGPGLSVGYSSKGEFCIAVSYLI